MIVHSQTVLASHQVKEPGVGWLGDQAAGKGSFVIIINIAQLPGHLLITRGHDNVHDDMNM